MGQPRVQAGRWRRPALEKMEPDRPHLERQGLTNDSMRTPAAQAPSSPASAFRADEAEGGNDCEEQSAAARACRAEAQREPYRACATPERLHKVWPAWLGHPAPESCSAPQSGIPLRSCPHPDRRSTGGRAGDSTSLSSRGQDSRASSTGNWVLTGVSPLLVLGVLHGFLRIPEEAVSPCPVSRIRLIGQGHPPLTKPGVSSRRQGREACARTA
jgi:hypothetical protein